MMPITAFPRYTKSRSESKCYYSFYELWAGTQSQNWNVLNWTEGDSVGARVRSKSPINIIAAVEYKSA